MHLSVQRETIEARATKFDSHCILLQRSEREGSDMNSSQSEGSQRTLAESASQQSLRLNLANQQYTSMDNIMLRRAIQNALRNYYAAHIVRPARMSICIDYTDGAPAYNNLSPFLRYRNPSVVFKMTADEDVRQTQPLSEQKKAKTRDELLEWIKDNCAVSNELINDHNQYPLKKAKIRALSSATPKAVIELACAAKQMATVIELAALRELKRKEGDGRIDEKNETFDKNWKRMVDEDRRQLYSDVRSLSPLSQNEKQDTSLGPRTPISPLKESKTKDVGILTDFDEEKDLGEPSGMIDFEPANNNGHVNKAVQARGKTDTDP
uniref:Plus3 domain-containing protein n=1 Tax=Ascaris lumbricoides TaxID=6252 RepID=A0A0M3ICY7_ASCLU